MAQIDNPWIAWLAGIVLTIVLGALGWLAIQTYEMKGGLSEVKGGVAVVSGEVRSTSDRVERIAKALPEMNRYIASEDISAPISGMVVFGKPIQNKRGSWLTNLVLLDSKSSVALKYKWPLRGKDDQSAAYLVVGSIKSIDQQAVTFAHLKKSSQEMGAVVSIPASFNTNVSFVLREKSIEEYAETLSKVAGKPERTKINIEASNWSEFTLKMMGPNKLEEATNTQ